MVTVSPVRHTRDGVIENSLSKSTLICAAHCLIKEFPSFVSYFPAYEYMIDELRLVDLLKCMHVCMYVCLYVCMFICMSVRISVFAYFCSLSNMTIYVFV